MSLETGVIDSAVNKKYSEFSDAIKTELKTKLANNSDIKKYVDDFDKIQQMKTLFAKINTEE